MKSWMVPVLLASAGLVEPASGQRLLEEWQVRTTAGAEALVHGAAAVFWNPARVGVSRGRIEALVLDLRAPDITGVNGVAAAASLTLDERTSLALGYEHVGVEGIERTSESPDGGSPIDFGENRFAAAASHRVGDATHVGALVRYTRLPQILSAEEADMAGLLQSVIALGAGVRHRPVRSVPIELAAMAATEGSEMYWLAGVEFASFAGWRDWSVGAEYGAAGGQLAPGVTHRGVLVGELSDLAEVTAGVVVEPDGRGHSWQPVLGAALRLNRYQLGMVREQLPNEFGSAYSFRFSVVF